MKPRKTEMCRSNCLNSKKTGVSTAKICFLWHSWIPRLYTYESVWFFSLVRKLRYFYSCEITLKCMYLKSSLKSSLLRREICFLERPYGIPVIQCSLTSFISAQYNTLKLFCSKKDTALNEDHIWATLHSRGSCFKDAEVHCF